MYKYLCIILLSIFFLPISSYSQNELKPQGIYPTGMCSMDYNAWGNASICACSDSYRYEKRAGLCIPKDSVLTEIFAEGTLISGVVAIGGETTGVELISNVGSYELILELKTLENLELSSGLSFEVLGELIYLPNIERQSRPAIIVKEMNLLK
ncbi:MAG: hypothetical protein AB8G05_18490 [Oligoflexales bacterium]